MSEEVFIVFDSGNIITAPFFLTLWCDNRMRKEGTMGGRNTQSIIYWSIIY